MLSTLGKRVQNTTTNYNNSQRLYLVRKLSNLSVSQQIIHLVYKAIVECFCSCIFVPGTVTVAVALRTDCPGSQQQPAKSLVNLKSPCLSSSERTTKKARNILKDSCIPLFCHFEPLRSGTLAQKWFNVLKVSAAKWRCDALETSMF